MTIDVPALSPTAASTARLGPRDRAALRVLAARVAEIAALPEQADAERAWRRLNGLTPDRPLVMVAQLPWMEMDVDRELDLVTENPFCRWLETVLRRTIYTWRHLRVDTVVRPVFDVPRVTKMDGFGVDVNERTLRHSPESDIASHEFSDQLASDDDVQRIRPPRIEVDVEASARVEAIAREVLDGFLGVRVQGVAPHFDLWDQIVSLRGAEPVLLDLVDRPDFMHAIASRLAEASLAMLDQLELDGLLAVGQDTVHCTGAFTDELPAPGHDPQRPRARDTWTYGMAQIFAAVSRGMFEEFELPYAGRWYARFGLVYYGCCDPLHDRIDLVRRLPNVRKVSISPWADVERAASSIGPDFVFSRKPSPTPLALDSWEPEAIAADLRRTVEACERAGCPLEIILKDVSTVRGRPDRVWEWTAIASRVVGR